MAHQSPGPEVTEPGPKTWENDLKTTRLLVSKNSPTPLDVRRQCRETFHMARRIIGSLVNDLRQIDQHLGTLAAAIPKPGEQFELPEDWTKVQQALAGSEFWNLQTNEQSLGLDGARWVLEVAEYDRDHVVDRWSGGEVESIGRLLLELSQLDPEPIY